MLFHFTVSLCSIVYGISFCSLTSQYSFVVFYSVVSLCSISLCSIVYTAPFTDRYYHIIGGFQICTKNAGYDGTWSQGHWQLVLIWFPGLGFLFLCRVFFLVISMPWVPFLFMSFNGSRFILFGLPFFISRADLVFPFLSFCPFLF